ncbi:hypothetical protein K1T34_18080 [Amycolatopsis sp. DSM 110486]|nr:alkaline phosphatase family protein [Amycolatopsis sp. DSM 110486]QYN24181.1 hypothetical protein K1T34_18080 [Amycolatopsis sp. DSM 110486]
MVVVMFENRSFDNLLGRLYEPGEVAAFDGVRGKELSNPIPEWAGHGDGRGVVPYGVAPTMDTPNPDPGEEYQHVNTQLFGLIDPPGNRATLAEHMVAPYNAPEDGRAPTMDGFVADYISAFRAEMGREPGYDEYAQIMTGYTPQQMPVVSALARGFATFDHWFAEVPTQTFANRSFLHAATSSGLVVNAPYGNFPLHNTATTVFERLEAARLSWRVYVDPPSRIPFTGLIHAPRLRDRFATHFVTTDRFLQDAQEGTLPAYSFIEPNLWHGHNDMHPPISALAPGIAFDAPSSLLGGEALLAKIYNAVRASSSPDGSNCFNTLLMVTFDEHGGTYDHVPPPAATPPDPAPPARAAGLCLRPARRPRARDRDLGLDPAADRRHRRTPPHLGDPDVAAALEPRHTPDRTRRDRARPCADTQPRRAPHPRRLARRPSPAGTRVPRKPRARQRPSVTLGHSPLPRLPGPDQATRPGRARHPARRRPHRRPSPGHRPRDRRRPLPRPPDGDSPIAERCAPARVTAGPGLVQSTWRAALFTDSGLLQLRRDNNLVVSGCPHDDRRHAGVTVLPFMQSLTPPLSRMPGADRTRLRVGQGPSPELVIDWSKTRRRSARASCGNARRAASSSSRASTGSQHGQSSQGTYNQRPG